jgi:hypothetical protein
MLDQLLLVGRVVRPPRRERAGSAPEAGKVLALAAVVRRGVTLEVEVNVAGAGLRGPTQAATD